MKLFNLNCSFNLKPHSTINCTSLHLEQIKKYISFQWVPISIMPNL